MTPRQKRIFLVLAVAIALTRFLAVAHSLFDWDEALFSLGVRDYEVTDHRPHPPGYPLFVAAGKLVHAAGVENEFRALQVVVVLGALFIFPAVFFFARQLGYDFATSISGAAIFAFLPNVWIYSGTGFSDIPATALAIGGCALLLRGRHDSRAYILGAVLLGLAGGMRVPSFMLGAAPALVATYHRLRARAYLAVAAAIVLGAAIVAGSYLGAALASYSVPKYFEAVRGQSEYVRDIDSWRNPGRPPLHNAAKTFFLWPVAWRQGMVALAALAALGAVLGIVRRRVAPIFTLVIFVPVAIAAWLNLDIAAASRYAITYMPMHALLAAEGLRVLGRNPRVQGVLASILIAVFVVWAWPAVQTQRTTDAPPAAALNWIRKNVDPHSTVYIHGGLGPHASYLLPDHQKAWFETTGDISLLFGDSWVVHLEPVPNGMNHILPRNALWKIVRRRNFESSVSRVSTLIRYEKGWYDDEGPFRWMGYEATATLPAFGGMGELKLDIYLPLDAIPPPTIEVVLNGRTVERFVAKQAELTRTWTVPSRSDAPNELILRTSGAANPAKMRPGAHDTRDLGIRVNDLSWTPVR